MLKIISPFKSFFLDVSLSTTEKFFSFLLILLPIALLTGPAIPDIFISMIALFFLIISLHKKLWHYYSNPIVYGFLFFSFYGVANSLIISDNPIESLSNEGSVFYFRYIFFSLGVWYLSERSKYLSKCLVVLGYAIIMIVCFDSLFQYLFGHNIIGIEKFNPERLTGIFNDEPIIGRYLSLMTIFIFALIFNSYEFSKNTILLSIALLFLSGSVVFLSGERAPFFHFVFFLFLILVFYHKLRLYLLISIFLSTLTIVAITSFDQSAKQRMLVKTFDQVSSTKFPFLPYNLAYERVYGSALNIFVHNPIFGGGTNLFEYNCHKEKYFYHKKSCRSHPHNYYFQVLSEMGLIGFFFIFSFYSYLLSKALSIIYHQIKNTQKNKDISSNSFILLALLAFWWPLIPHMSLYNNWNNVLIMLPLGFFMKNFYKGEK